MNIMVLDDDTFFLDQMKKLLEHDNHSIVTTTSGYEALGILHETNFDLIFSDLKMPEISGIDFLKKSRESGNDSIFIVITGYGTIETAVEAIKSGAHDYLLKPFEYPTLQKIIKEVETDITFRKKLDSARIIEKSNQPNDFKFKSIGTEFESPFLVISDINPNILIDKFGIPQATQIWIECNNRKMVSSRFDYHVYKSRSDEFIQSNSKGTIIFEGIEKINNCICCKPMLDFLVYIQTKVISSNIQFLVVLEKKESLSKPIYPNQIFSSLLRPAFDKIIDLLSHPLRRNTILVLKSHPGLSFNEITKKLSVESSSVIAFHIKKLVEENILIKDKMDRKPQYSLSIKGAYLADIISTLEDLGEKSPFSSLKVIRIKN